MSRELTDLHIDMERMARQHIARCKLEGVDLLIYCTLRSNEEQDAAYAIGRTKPGKIITNARAGESAHNPDENGKAHAYDCCPVIHGKAIWDTKHPAWAIVIRCGEACGLIASARWTGKLKESAHFQDPEWRKPNA